jgi:hypothetical protein
VGVTTQITWVTFGRNLVNVGYFYPYWSFSTTFTVHIFDVYFLLAMENENSHRIFNIGVLKEKNLHAMIKEWYSHPGDRLETRVDGYVIDIFRDGLLIEIQTRGFWNIKKKLLALTENHPVHLVYPISKEKWIVKEYGPGIKKRRKSPYKKRLEHIFSELVRIPQVIASPNFTFEALLIQEEEIQVNDGKGSWRRKGWSIKDRHLLAVLEQHVFTSLEDYLALLPSSLPPSFTIRELAVAAQMPHSLAQKTAYCLRQMGVLHRTGKRGRAYLYEKDVL